MYVDVGGSGLPVRRGSEPHVVHGIVAAAYYHHSPFPSRSYIEAYDEGSEDWLARLRCRLLHEIGHVLGAEDVYAGDAASVFEASEEDKLAARHSTMSTLYCQVAEHREFPEVTEDAAELVTGE